MPLNINGTTGISGVDGSASAPAVTGTDSNTGINFGTDTVNINTGGTTKASIDSAGALDVPSNFPIKVNGSEKLRLDSDGRLLLGTDASAGTATDLKLQVIHPTGSALLVGSSTASTGNTAVINFAPANSITGTQLVSESTEDFSVTANRSAKFTIRCRVNGNFYDNLAINAAGQQDNFSVTNAGDHFKFRNTTTSNTGTMLFVESGRNSTNGSYKLAQWGSTTAARFQVFDSGTVQNSNGSYGSISDQTLKENIVDAGSQWADIKNIKVRNFNFIETTDPDKKTMLGVVAQEAETVCPNLVETTLSRQNGEEKEVKSFKYSILYMKAVKCLQEAQARIETLETEKTKLQTDLTALTARVTALEAG